MTDPRRLSTAEVINYGILNQPMPKSSLPDAREWVTTEDIPDEQALAILRDETKGLHSSNYYGIPHLWKEGNKYRGILLQYRVATENRTFVDEEGEAFAWYKRKCAETDG